MLNEAIAANQVPGLVAMIVKDGKIVYQSSKALRTFLHSKNGKGSDLPKAGSQTKAITSTAVMMLWEEGKFQLTDRF